MKIIPLSIVALLSSVTVLFAQAPASRGVVVEHTYYSLSYSEPDEQAEWVYYHLTPELLAGTAKRTDDFRPDPKVASGSATLDDYRGSGYDRGHLCPAASMSRSHEAISESFFMSNMSPQAPSFNRGMWKKLEEAVRSTASADSVVYVVCGPILSEPMGTIGANKVSVPNSYYKVLYSPKRSAMIGFVMPNKKLAGAISDYVVSVDRVEELTGIDFFAGAEPKVEKLESVSNYAVWSFAESKPLPKAPTASQSANSQQCKGITASGTRCKNSTKNSNGYCHLHQKQVK